jgi:hypothetical protein
MDTLQRYAFPIIGLPLDAIWSSNFAVVPPSVTSGGSSQIERGPPSQAHHGVKVSAGTCAEQLPINSSMSSPQRLSRR